MKNSKQIWGPALALFLICLITTFLLAVTNNLTAEKIDILNEQTAAEARSQVLSSATDFEKSNIDGNEYYIGTDDSGNAVGYVFSIIESGYGGELSVMAAFDTEGVVTGIKVIECSETAGLGLNATQQKFADRFTGTDGELSVLKNGTPSDNEILAITGATITTTAVTDAVNSARALYEKIPEVKVNER